MDLSNQYTTYKTYHDIGLITAASILAYELSADGMLDVYDTGSNITAEEFQHVLKKDFNLKALPCLFCDATIGACSDLNQRLEAMFQQTNKFITDSIDRAEKYGWDGYMVDFESDTAIDHYKLTNFIIDWSERLATANLSLYVWIGGPASYQMDLLYNSDTIHLVTMDTYYSDYQNYILKAGIQQLSLHNVSKFAVGLLTYNQNGGFFQNNNDADIMEIIQWSVIAKIQTLSIWAAGIPPSWYEALIYFINQ